MNALHSHARQLFGAAMHPRSAWMPNLLSLVIATFFCLTALGEDAKPAATTEAKPSGPESAQVTAARERAKLLHDVYTATLDVIHHRYFRRDHPVLPAKAMEDIFEEMAGRSGTMANWISVNTKAMSINHEPTTAFEKQAAAEISAGKESIERVTKRVYQRATVIPLKASCVGCHTKMFSEEPKTPRFAGLVISIPLITEKK